MNPVKITKMLLIAGNLPLVFFLQFSFFLALLLALLLAFITERDVCH